MEGLKEIAHIAGKPGLFRVIKPTRTGVIVEGLQDKVRTVAGSQSKVSILKEITMYTLDEAGGIALGNVFSRIQEKYQGQLPVSAKSENSDLFKFMESVVPEYDSEKVYASDIKKLVSWYLLLFNQAPEVFTSKAEDGKPSEQ